MQLRKLHHRVGGSTAGRGSPPGASRDSSTGASTGSGGCAFSRPRAKAVRCCRSSSQRRASHGSTAFSACGCAPVRGRPGCAPGSRDGTAVPARDSAGRLRRWRGPHRPAAVIAGGKPLVRRQRIAALGLPQRVGDLFARGVQHLRFDGWSWPTRCRSSGRAKPTSYESAPSAAEPCATPPAGRRPDAPYFSHSLMRAASALRLMP